MHHRHNRGYFGLLSEVWETFFSLPPDVGSVNCWKAFVKQNTLLDCGNNECPPPAVVMMQWKPIQRFLKQNRPYSESLALALFRCYVEHINLCFWNQVVLHWNIPGLHLHYINSIGLTCYDITLEFLKRCLYLPGHISAQNDSNKNLIMLGHSVWKQTLPLFPLIKPTQHSFIFAYSAAGTLILIIS